MMSGLILFLSFFQYESPRFLVKQGKSDEAAQVLSRLRQQPADSDYIATEVATVQTALALELEATKGIGWWGKVKEVFTVPSNLYRFYLATMVQILSQWSGAGSITVYAPDLFKLLGVTGNEESLLVTAVFGLVKFAAAIICALFLVDVIGRKRSLLIGITFQSLSILYIAAFLTAVPELGVEDNFILPNSDKGASRGAIAMIYISGVGWALGWNSMQYLITAELFPLRIRALATSWAMALHFANQYGNSRALPSMLLPFGSGGLSPKGTFWCLGSVTVIGGLWVWFFVPETGGRSLESMGELFELPWYRIGLYGNEDAEQRDLQHKSGDKQSVIENQDSNVQQVENHSKA